MQTLILMSVPELCALFAERAQARRLALDLTQAGLAARAGVSLGSLKRFEQTGRVSFESLLKVAAALGAVDDFDAVFKAPAARSIDEVLAARGPQRKRGRRS
jgi:transcriptional regulator with XRE-family HTH domain